MSGIGSIDGIGGIGSIAGIGGLGELGGIGRRGGLGELGGIGETGAIDSPNNKIGSRLLSFKLSTILFNISSILSFKNCLYVLIFKYFSLDLSTIINLEAIYPAFLSNGCLS